MGSSAHVTAFKPADDRWKKMKSVYDSCMEAKCEIPKEVYQFFEGNDPDENGVVVNIKTHPCCKEWHAEMCDGFEVDVSKLPKDVTIIRFYVSY